MKKITSTIPFLALIGCGSEQAGSEQGHSIPGIHHELVACYDSALESDANKLKNKCDTLLDTVQKNYTVSHGKAGCQEVFQSVGMQCYVRAFKTRKSTEWAELNSMVDGCMNSEFEKIKRQACGERIRIERSASVWLRDLFPLRA